MSRTWSAWKIVFRLAHLKRQRQILAETGGEPLGGAHAAIPVMGKMEAALDNLALAATSNKSTVQQLKAENLALTMTVANLTASNTKLVDAVSSKQKGGPKPGAAAGAAATPGEGWTKNGNYCWTHGHRVGKNHTSETCKNKAERHKIDATAADTNGGCTDNKDWEKA